MPNSSLTEQIRAKAISLGASTVGIARVRGEEIRMDRERLKEWMDSGFAGEMEYLKKNEARRSDPRLSLDGVRSLVALGYDYAFPSQDESADSARRASGAGRIARYARGRDYHRIIPKHLKKLLAHIQEIEPGCNGLGFVDTGPLLERAWASRSGIGWVGKHSLLLRQQGGSWFLLGILLLDLELEPDPTAEERCGTCRSCIDVCPTGAIVAPYKVDARRCISYLTIELRGPIPRDLRPLMSDYIFGCDDCQDVCPWNRHAAEAKLDDYRARAGVLDTPLVDWLQLTTDEFRRRFEGSPIARAKRDGFLRNVCVALGNRGDGSAIPSLATTLREDPSDLVRIHAAWALGKIGGESARRVLTDVLANERDPETRKEIGLALSNGNESPSPRPKEQTHAHGDTD